MDKNTASKKIYNIIFAGGSVPPMIGALVTIENGYETYAYIERGRLYNGIEKLDNFYNIGFDTDKTKSIDKEPPFELTAQKIKELKEKTPDCYFNLYTNESRALRCAAVAANAGLAKEDFHIYMMEDGIDTYKKLDFLYGGITAYQPVRNLLLKLTKREWFSIEIAKKVAAVVAKIPSPLKNILKYFFDKKAYSMFRRDVKTAANLFDSIMAKNNHRFNDPLFLPDYHWPFPLSCIENFTYILQSKAKVDSIIGITQNSWLMSSFGVKGADCQVQYNTNVVSAAIPSMVEALSAEQRAKYETLVFDRFAKDLENSIGRKERADKTAPDKKLVYISSRLDTMFIHPATDKVYGTGGVSSSAQIPSVYTELDEKYKTAFIFPTEEDYNLLRGEMTQMLENTPAPRDMVENAMVKIFNIYTDYVFTAKLIYMLYGDRYDIIVKNHPMTDIGNSADWREYYRPEYDGEKFLDIGGCLDKALQNFHSSDSVGRYVGFVSGGVSTENFEYLGADISFAGQPSSVYNGLSDNAEIPFMITDADGDITGGGTTQFSYSAVSGRYLAGNMNFTDRDGKKQPTVFLNTGNVLKACAFAAEKAGDTALASQYEKLFAVWMGKTHPSAKDIDPQGFAVK